MKFLTSNGAGTRTFTKIEKALMAAVRDSRQTGEEAMIHAVNSKNELTATYRIIVEDEPDPIPDFA